MQKGPASMCACLLIMVAGMLLLMCLLRRMVRARVTGVCLNGFKPGCCGQTMRFLRKRYYACEDKAYREEFPP